MEPISKQILSLQPEESLSLTLSAGCDSKGELRIKNISGKRIAIKMKTNAGKNIIASPGFFVMGIDEEITMEVMIRSPNVDHLIAIRKVMHKRDEQYKLQFNILELTSMFYDKVKGANPEDLYQLLSKRWNMTEKRSIQQLIMPVYLSFELDSADDSIPCIDKDCPKSSNEEDIGSMEEKYRNVLMDNIRLRERHEDLEKRYNSLKKQYNVLKSDLETRMDNVDQLAERESFKKQTELYSGITLYQLLLSTIAACVVGMLVALRFFK